MYTSERQEQHRALLGRVKNAEERITEWETLTEDEDRIYYEELQALNIFADILEPEQNLLTVDGFNYIDQRVEAVETWIKETMPTAGEESDG